MFKVEYLTSNRRGTTDMRVSANAVGQTTTPQQGQQGGGGAAGGAAGAQAQQAAGGGRLAEPGQSTHVATASTNDFWREMFATLAVLVGCTTPTQATAPAPATATDRDIWGCESLEMDAQGRARPTGRRLVVSPQSGTILVRAMPEEIKSVAAYLRASQASVERQVLIEAKILEVALRDGYETGINWAGFFSRVQGQTLGIGLLTPGARLGTTASGVLVEGNPGARIFPTPLLGGVAETNTPLGTFPTGRAIAAAESAAGSIFGIALQGRDFAALMSFLDSQGVVHTLSSPRIATMNNQKAVLKVGSDTLFVTRITGGSTQVAAVGTAPQITSPTFEVQSFFSGIALDVTPRIGEDGSIVLHVRPSVTDVTQVSSTFNLGVLGTFTIPLVNNAVSETDSVIRAVDGQIVAIGGLMRTVQRETRNQVPGVGDVPFLGAAFRNVNQGSEKRELVILLKPTIVQSEETWARDILEARERIRTMDRGFSFGGRGEVFGADREKYKP
jgi:MSHA biogenesis protein MshL